MNNATNEEKKRFVLSQTKCKSIPGYKIDKPNSGERKLKSFCKKRSLESKIISSKITCQYNNKEPIHRWSSYIHGFSASFVNNILEKYKGDNWNVIMDPFCGAGTVAVASIKMERICISTDVNPYLTFVTKIKTNKNINLDMINSISVPWDYLKPAEPPFLNKTSNHFSVNNLKDLLKLKTFITEQDGELSDIIKAILSFILIPASKLQRQPNLGYRRKMTNYYPSVRALFAEKLKQIQNDAPVLIRTEGDSHVIFASATDGIIKNDNIDLIITSPPYSNGVDYFFNYKLELAWLDFCTSYKDGLELKKWLIGGDNTQRKYLKPYLDIIPEGIPGCDNIRAIEKNIQKRRKQYGSKGYQRTDIPAILSKYFIDMKQVLTSTQKALRDGGRMILVQGDSLFSDIYIPSDLIVAEMAEEIGFDVLEIATARTRTSGQRRNFPLRESVITLGKN